MPTITVNPRPTPEERADVPVDIEVDEALTVHAATLEDWLTPRQGWELQLLQGHDFDRPNNVEARLLFVSGEQTASLQFRLDQLDSAADDVDGSLVLRFEEEDGIAKVARLTANGIDVELFHILTYT